VNKVTDEFHKQMKCDVGNLCGASFHGVVKRQHKIRTEFIYNIYETEREICDRAEQLKRDIEQDKHSLLEELKSYKKDRIKHINQIIDQVQLYVSFTYRLVECTA